MPLPPVAELLDVPFDRFTLEQFDAALFNPDEVVWSGGISTTKRVPGQPTVFEPKVGTFFAPLVLDPELLPELDSPEWLTGKCATAARGLYQPCLMAEMDTGTVQEQLARLHQAIDAGLPVPTAVVLSGDVRPPHEQAEPGKSVHVFWRVEENPYRHKAKAEEDYRVRAQLALAVALDGDRSIKDPSRRMRLGGVVSYQAGPFKVDPSLHPRVQTILYLGERINRREMDAWALAQPIPKGAGAVKPAAHVGQNISFASTRSEEWDASLAELAAALSEEPSGKLSLCCPFHEDTTPSAFVAKAERSGRAYLHCSVCKETWWDAPEVDLSYTKEGAPRVNLANTAAVLLQDTYWRGRLWYNERTRYVMLDAKPMTDADASEARVWLYRNYAFEPSFGVMFEAMVMVAHRDSRNPLTAYLDGLAWDGVERLDTWLIDTLRIQDTPLHRAYSRLWPVTCAARAYDPGCKVDSVLLVIGNQGARKSTLFRALASPEWFRDTELDLSSKDVYMQVAAAWVYEIAEMSAFSRAEIARVRALITSQVDTYRAPYERTIQDHPRHTVMVVTSNDFEPLNDPAGSRRYWVVHTPATMFNPINTTRIELDRDQLWAEAVHRYKAGERWHLTTENENEREVLSQLFTTEDPREMRIAKWIHSLTKDTFTLDEVMTSALGLAPRDAPKHRSMVSNLLHNIGCIKLGRNRVDGVRVNYWQKPKDEGESHE